MKVQKIEFFSEGFNPCFWPKHAIFFYLDFIKIRLEVMLSDFQRKKKPFLTLKKIIFQSPKNCTFPKALTRAFSPKMPRFRLFRFGQNKKQNFSKSK